MCIRPFRFSGHILFGIVLARPTLALSEASVQTAQHEFLRTLPFCPQRRADTYILQVTPGRRIIFEVDETIGASNTDVVSWQLRSTRPLRMTKVRTSSTSICNRRDSSRRPYVQTEAIANHDF